MNNTNVCDYIKNELEPNKATGEKKYFADLFVENGYGQSCGGYLEHCSKDKINPSEISQAKHFLQYYDCNDKSEKKPTYQYLRCPQLLLYIAEIAGLKGEYLNSAVEIVSKYELDNNLVLTEKNGNYLWGKKEFREFKSELRINVIVGKIKHADNWNEVIEEVKKL